MSNQEQTPSPDLLSEFKSQLEIAESRAQEREAALKASLTRELEIQANKIHSSYARKLKKLGLADDAGEQQSDSSPVDDAAEIKASRRPTSRELELQASVEKLIKRAEDGEKRARLATFKSQFTDQLIRNGILPEAADTIFLVQQARNAFQDDGEELGFKMKVDVDGAPVALPLDSAVKHYAKSPEARFFQAPKGAAGSGASAPLPTKATDGKPRRSQMEVDWSAVGQSMFNGDTE